jgi:hypothetical protein
MAGDLRRESGLAAHISAATRPSSYWKSSDCFIGIAARCCCHPVTAIAMEIVQGSFCDADGDSA